MCRTHTDCPLLIVPEEAVYAAVQPTEYVPSVMLMGTAPLIPEITMALEVRTEPRGTPDCVTKEKASGVVSQASVVTLNVRGTPAIVSVGTVVVSQLAEAAWRTRTVWPLSIVPATEV